MSLAMTHGVPFAAGDRVTVRGECWVVQDATPFSDVTLLHLAGGDDRTHARRIRLLTPFDHPIATNWTPRFRAMTRRRWMHHLHAHVSEVRAFGDLRAPQGSAIDLLPFQLEPVLALVRGYASRFLLADEVGLGKTIQAGLVVAELRARGWCEHALIVTPAGLRQQWAEELRHRFNIDAAIIDVESLAATSASLPFDVNPWAVEPVAITSIDFLKQPEVLRGVATQLWDVLIVDEAHQAAHGSLRYDAINAIAKCARHVMLLTATPHAGDDRAYRALCALGEATGPSGYSRGSDDSMVLFRRTRELAGLPRARRVHLLPVAMTRHGSEMHRLLDEYVTQLWALAREPGKQDLQLVAMILAKRAFSSARSLATSLIRRIAGLTGEDSGPSQPALPLVFEDDISDEAQLPSTPAFSRTGEERAVLKRLLEVARLAQMDDRKLHAIGRILRRTREPVIIFTEYRDTLGAIGDQIGTVRGATTLHGGQTAHERRQSVEAFTSGAADVMLATDAGSEGLNLQPTCRLVINLELPWNPIRLEQRIGRIDRIGQTRTVHAINLLAAGTAERRVLAGLLGRIDRIRLSEIEIAACVMTQSEPPSRPRPLQSCTQTIDLSAEARAAAHRMTERRRVREGVSTLCRGAVPVTVIRSRRPALIAFFRIRLVTRTGRLVDEELLPVRLPLGRMRGRLRRKEARALAETLIAEFGTHLMRHARAHAHHRARSLANEAADASATAIRRERAVAQQAVSENPLMVQAGLFDARALKQKRTEEETPRRAPRYERQPRKSPRGRSKRPPRTRTRDRHASHQMLAGLSGSLVSHHFAERMLEGEFAGRLGEASLATAGRSYARWWRTQASQLGTASSIRAIWELAAAPLVELLGFSTAPAADDGTDVRHAMLVASGVHVALVAAAWDRSLDNLWRDAARRGIGLDVAWVLCTNGRELRLVDTQRTYSRAYMQFDLQRTADHPPTFAVLWAALRAEAFRSRAGEPPLVLEIIRSSARHGQAVSRSLRTGVIESVQHLLNGLNKCGSHNLSQLFDESLTVVYRVLFLMFAESRSLVPNWHPVYRESYTVESLRARAERTGKVPGLWEALQAISRLAHKGCRAGSLIVPPFNGRLFSPARSPIAESCAVDDEVAREALLALSTAAARPRGWQRAQATRTRIDYRDLGVEQLGAVYESVLDYEPAYADSRRDKVLLRRGGGARRSTGSFYTPQTLTDYVVRRTLHPLVDGASAERILRLRIVDPAMGSAAFLVSACRYLARAYERALVREGSGDGTDIDEAERATFRRLVAQRCLFGVDMNPTAVQLARLSLWLATLSANKPLTFLDHHLVCGNSLIGASLFDIARQPRRARRRAANDVQTPLFSEADFTSSLGRAVVARRWMADTRDDTVEVVREKERRLDGWRAGAQWRSIADLWCACWMWPDRNKTPEPAVFASLVDRLRTGRSGLPDRTAAALLHDASSVSRAHRFFHWMLEFPEAYFDEAGQPITDSGFDAVLGNPPWDMLGADAGDKAFFRCSGVYRHQGAGRMNRYQLFVERALALTKRGGRIGLVLPAGFATDHTSARLRSALLSRTGIDAITGFDNRRAIFPIHRSVRFLICTSTVGGTTDRIACRFGLDDPAELEAIPDSGDRSVNPSHPVTVTRSFIEALSGHTLGIPELRSEADVRILERVLHSTPRLDAAEGWNVRFGRELNATDDRAHFHAGRTGLPVLEGKHIEPFRVHADRTTLRISEHDANRLLDAATTFSRERLAYRDVASSTNRLSLIAALLPPGVVTTHSLFCLKTKLSRENQAFLCAMMNSYVANYLVRLVMTTHLGSSTVEALRVPKPRFDSPLFGNIVEVVRQLRHSDAGTIHARLQALAARCYGLTEAEFAHILTTFPLIDAGQRDSALERFRDRDLLS